LSLIVGLQSPVVISPRILGYSPRP
jgi:hypothetical protein